MQIQILGKSELKKHTTFHAQFLKENVNLQVDKVIVNKLSEQECRHPNKDWIDEVTK